MEGRARTVAWDGRRRAAAPTEQCVNAPPGLALHGTARYCTTRLDPARIVADSGSDALLRSLDAVRAAVVRARVQLQRAVTRFSTFGTCPARGLAHDHMIDCSL